METNYVLFTVIFPKLADQILTSFVFIQIGVYAIFFTFMLSQRGNFGWNACKVLNQIYFPSVIFIRIKVLAFIICNGKLNYTQLEFKPIRT